MRSIQFLTTVFFLFWNAYGVASESIQPGAIWPDDQGIHINAHGGGMLYHDGVYYWFGEHKTKGEAGNKANVGVGVYASKDLVRWENRGIALAVSDDEQSPIAKGCILERPKVIYNEKTNRFVMWFHLELKGQGYSAAQTGVAVSETVEGPYQFIRASRTNAGVWPVNFSDAQKKASYDSNTLGKPKDPAFQEAVREGMFVVRDYEGGQMARDMTLFVDEDGKGYHISSAENNQTLHFSELSDDFLDFTGKYKRVFPGESNEAPAIFKRKGKYYLFSSGCTGWKPNPGRVSVADTIWGEWKALGNPCVGTPEELETTFWSQSTYVIPVVGKEDAFIYMGDRWQPKNAIDGRYIWLPVEWEDDMPVLRWRDSWNLSIFDGAPL